MRITRLIRFGTLIKKGISYEEELNNVNRNNRSAGGAGWRLRHAS